jgi:hypothetical protein
LVLSQELDETYRRIAVNLPANEDVCIDRRSGKDTLTVTNLDRIEEPESLITLREDVKAMLPIVDLPQLLLEIHARTGFANHLTHGSEGKARVAKLPVSICAVLLAEACNFGIEPLIRDDVPELTRSRLLWVQQNYIRAETLYPPRLYQGMKCRCLRRDYSLVFASNIVLQQSHRFLHGIRRQQKCSYHSNNYTTVHNRTVA